MGGLAVLAKQAGHTVTGCDANVYPPMSTQLEQQGIALTEGFGVEQLDLSPDLFVIGNVVTRGNPLMEAILNRGLPYVSGPQWMGEHILQHKWVLAVAGTHGKTTTSSMLAWILEFAGYAPGFLIGGVPLNFGVSARLHGATDSDFFVIEADEYDTAFFDKRSKFVHYHAKTAILNNLEFDHADIFPDVAAIEEQFHHLVRTVPGVGRVIVNRGEDSLERVLARGCWSEQEFFNGQAGQSDWHLQLCEGEAFEVFFKGASQGVVQWALNGAHNRLNALAAIAAARHVGVQPATAIAALAEFVNVKRRMELRGEVAGIKVIDDFAHHPTAIATTVAGLRRVQTSAGGGRILAVLEPRSNTMKMGAQGIKQALPGSLQDADRVYIYGAASGKDAVKWDMAETFSPIAEKTATYHELDVLVQEVVSEARTGDAILVMSNGGFGGVHQRLLDALASRYGN